MSESPVASEPTEPVVETTTESPTPKAVEESPAIETEKRKAEEETDLEEPKEKKKKRKHSRRKYDDAPPAEEAEKDSDDDDDDDDKDLDDDKLIVEDDEEDDLLEIDASNIITTGRRTRGKVIDYSKVSEKLGMKATEEDEEEDDGDFAEK
ncbi:hypothetical protein CANARDRAFT_21544 [[Candida] arabinofermentans NRRL YB-2248]|uniref:Histone H2A.Z-specific chaperone CHZ1 n=1 Tax=[Candida] arabinofermentans NRRL YB-2248 TaxID=983967 RepID=A0A1E4T7G5_9ASCO|nr:hypothetical protein CANARDRAFT_21544 [[Candida] arabinofermentans NRRL YB-2248]